MNKYVDIVASLKKKLEKGCGYEKTLHILHKLQKIPITIDLLHQTGIGKTVRNLSKVNADSDIGKTAKLLCLTWKASVKEEQEQDEQQEVDSHSNDESSVKREEPDDEDEVESRFNQSYDKSEPMIKKEEYNRSDDEELDRSVGDSSSDKRKHNDEYKSDKRHKKHKSSHKSRNTESTVSSKTEFETMLGLNDEIIRTNKKSPKTSRETEKNKKSNSNSNDKNKCYVKTERIEDWSDSPSKSRVNGLKTTPKDLDSNALLKPVDQSDILSSLPTPNYKPLPNRELIEERLEANRRKAQKYNQELSINVSSKKGRTAVFAGHARAKTYTHVLGLEELCLQVLIDNYDKLCYLGDAPYYLLKPVLQKCNPVQLKRIEKYNPQIMDETDELWQDFCAKEFKNREHDFDEDEETWRDFYSRCTQEREDRLKNITKNISHKQAKALPVRQTQFSDSVKTPREIRRKQEKSGYTPIGKAGHSGHSSSSSAHVKIVPEKPKVAPLMKKVLKLQKVRYRR